MMGRRGLNVEKGKQGFQPTRVGQMDVPSAAPRRITGTREIDVTDDTDYSFAYEAFQTRIDTDPKLIERIRELETEVDEHAGDYEQARSDLAEAEQEWQNAKRASKEYENSIRGQKEALIADAKEAITLGKAAAFRLYQEAGVDERFARYFSGDIAQAALKGRESGYGPWGAYQEARPVNPLRFFTKRRFAEQTQAAADAAKRDPEWKAATKRVKGAVEAYRELDHCPELVELRKTERAALDALSKARRDASEARQQIGKKQEILGDLYARREAGAPLDAQKQYLAGDYRANNRPLMRNPNGTTNVWVAIRTDSGLQYERVVGVDVTQRWGQRANALVTDSGKVVQGVRHIFNGPGDGWNANPSVLVSEPHPDAALLSAEGTPGRGFSISVDTTD